MIVSINQPAYLPWLGYFDRIIKSDVHVVLDHVQFEKNSMVNRNKIRTAQGHTMLTVPVRTKGKFGDLAIDALEIDCNQRWAGKHMKSVQGAYAKAPYFKEHWPFFEDIYGREWTGLHPLMREITAYFLQSFEIETKILYSSDMGAGGEKADLVLNICKDLDAKTYVSGPFGRDYLDEAVFQREGIALVFQDYNHPEYPQFHGGFEPYMSALDLLMNCGPDSLAVLEDKEASWLM